MNTATATGMFGGSLIHFSISIGCKTIPRQLVNNENIFILFILKDSGPEYTSKLLLKISSSVCFALYNGTCPVLNNLAAYKTKWDIIMGLVAEVMVAFLIKSYDAFFLSLLL